MLLTFRIRPLVALTVAALSAAWPLASRAADEAAPEFVPFVGQRFWFATLESGSADAQTGLTPGGTPVVRAQTKRYEASDTLAITTFGVRRGGWSVFGSVMPSIRSAAGDAVAGGTVKRSERDLGLSYQVSPGLSASLVYKVGSVAPVASPSMFALTQVPGEQSGRAILLGLSGAATLDERLSLFGSLGLGPTRWTTKLGVGQDGKSNGRYTITEVGLSYRLVDPGQIKLFSAVNVQLGYRLQHVSIDAVSQPTFRLDGTVVSVEQVSTNALTHGALLGLSASF